MIPISDKNYARTTPFVMYILIVLNIMVFLYDLSAGDKYFGRLWNWSMVPASVLSNVKIVPQIVQNGHLSGFVADPSIGPHPQWLTIFTSMFMHGSIMHIAGNMLFLWIFGNNIEDKLGHIKFLLFYIGCGVIAAFTHIAVSFATGSQFIPTVGASGAIAGVLGAYIILFPHAKVKTLIPIIFFVSFVDLPAIVVLGLWFITQLTGVLNTGGQLGGGVAYGAHIGGFIAGAAYIILKGRNNILRRTRRYTTYNSDDNSWI